MGQDMISCIHSTLILNFRSSVYRYQPLSSSKGCLFYLRSGGNFKIWIFITGQMTAPLKECWASGREGVDMNERVAQIGRTMIGIATN